ncbi:hypothetical protein KKB83_04995 [Patescibacteria group bacterium]|nr:hypothetical protein [Patescibacteria group bacterium]
MVGRILRQPYARKTKVKELDESYAFVYQQRGETLLKEIRAGFEKEGLGDLANKIAGDEGFADLSQVEKKSYGIRDKFQVAARNTILPVFTILKNEQWQKVNYDADISSNIDWTQVNLKPIFNLTFTKREKADTEQVATLSEDTVEVVKLKAFRKLRSGSLSLDRVFMTRQFLDIVPNPWEAHKFSKQVLETLVNKNGKNTVINNSVFIIEETRKLLAKEKDRLSELVFRNLLDKEKLRFLVIGDNLSFKLPVKKEVSASSRPLITRDGLPLQESLFDYVPSEELNTTEKEVAWYLEGHEKMFFWYRNIERQDYAIQGWRKYKIYPDFIFTTIEKKETGEYDKVFVVETKGIHLKNEDTSYKQEVFAICNEMAESKNLRDLADMWKNKEIRFEVVFDEEWERRLNSLLQ